nr:uncharacterized protein LOC126537419 [Dermacentor andersoni]
MIWGARSLVRNATVVLLLNYVLLSAKASLVVASSSKSTAAVDRLRRHDDQLSEVLIEHVKGADDTQAALSVFLGLLIIGAVILVVLFFLGCLLLLRLSESSPSAKYHRLLPSQEACCQRSCSVTGQERSQVFTYVDLTNTDGSCQDHRQLAPRFLANFQTATKVDARDSGSRRQQQRGALSAETRGHLAKTDPPFRAGTAGAPSVRRTRSDELGGSNASSGKEATGAADRTSQPPTKRICVQHIAGTPNYRSCSLHDEHRSENYGERSVVVMSDEPQMEINVRDRFVKVRPHGDGSANDSPVRSDAAHTLHQAAPADMNRASSAQYPEQHNWHRNHSDLAVDQAFGISSIEPFSPWLPSPNGSGTTPPLFPNDFHAFTPSDHTSKDTLRSQQASETHPFPEPDLGFSHLDTAEIPATTTVPVPTPDTSLVPYDSPPLRESASMEIGKDRRLITGPEGSTMQYQQNIHTGHVDRTTCPPVPVTVKTELSVTSPGPVVVAEDEPVQPYERNVAVINDSAPGDGVKHGENSEAGHVESALESSTRDNHTAGKESEIALESKSDKHEVRLAPTESQNSDVHNEQRASRELAARLEDETTIESRVPPKWLPVERKSRELASSDQSNQQLTTLSDRTLASPVSQHPIEIDADTGLVTSPAYKTTLASLLPILSQSGGNVDVVDQLKSSAIQAAQHSTDDTRTLATAAGRDLDITLSPDVTKHERATELVESSGKTSITTPERHQKAPQADSSSSSGVKERTDSTDVFFTSTSPVAAQGSKDLISFNSEPSAGTPAERSEEKTDTDAPKMSVSPSKDDVAKRES